MEVNSSDHAWSPGSWRRKVAVQLPDYDDKELLQRVVNEIHTAPPVVFPGEVERAKSQIGDASEGDRFILQGGDCVERFEDCAEDRIVNKIKILLQMSIILTYAARKPVLKIGRIAGQYFKPRSNLTETINGTVLHTYRGDGINGNAPTIEDRLADPARLKQSYFSAASTLNFIRAMISGGFADLHNPYNWNLYSIEQTEEWQEYKEIVEHIVDAVTFMESFGGINTESVGNIDFFTSHEGLNLEYEEALTRIDHASGRRYNLGAHMLWIGDRTRHIDGAHVEYFRGIGNPLGVKVGSTLGSGELLELLETLNPDNERGRITLITRLGAENVRQNLPELIKAVSASGAKVTWSCDPMHGNSVSTSSGLKTRRFEDILAELSASFEVHGEEGSTLSGVHFELTGEDVTECIGGALNIGEADLDRNYESFCDPRLNYSQSMEMSFLISRYLNGTSKIKQRV
ncbi:MAG: 3-deoxy-7-phosphoheptulonate synthase [Spirochaetales bacterium]|jgi:3-deoxy-7-phosphoheptulonate synthase|nr:3-deoxy-7-phosphoheptulonate synthase [Spirochaetales bacterium]